MKKTKKKRPGVLVRFYADDLARLNQVCAAQCTPRENYCRRVIMTRVLTDQESVHKGGRKVHHGT
jgi:hypothetical protein